MIHIPIRIIHGSVPSLKDGMYKCIPLHSTVSTVILPDSSCKIPTGIIPYIPKGYQGIICQWSTMSWDRGLCAVYDTITNDSHKEIVVKVTNGRIENLGIQEGDIVAKLDIYPEVDFMLKVL